MPIMRVKTKGKVGYKFGRNGHIYYGKGAEAKAKLQGRAVYAGIAARRAAAFGG